MLQTPEVVAEFDAACDKLHLLLERFCEEQEIPFALLDKVAGKVRQGKVGELTSEEVSPTADALDIHTRVRLLGTEDDGLADLAGFFDGLSLILLTNDVRQDFLRLSREVDQLRGQ